MTSAIAEQPAPPTTRPQTPHHDRAQWLAREWLVTNGLGGYASGTVGGAPSRRYHGLLISALPAPLGRFLMLAQLSERLRIADGPAIALQCGPETLEPLDDDLSYLHDFRLELGLPVWHYRVGEVELEKRVLMPHNQNTVLVSYRHLNGPSGRLKLMPTVHFRPHDAEVSAPLPLPFRLTAHDDRYELAAAGDLPLLRVKLEGDRTAFTHEPRSVGEMVFRIEKGRGYAAVGTLWTPGYFRVDLHPGRSVTFVASTESWEAIQALSPPVAWQTERERRRRLIAQAHPALHEEPASQLVLAADQFLVRPVARVEDAARAHAAGDDVRTVIAGYHWFTDWGRDTMISLEGLTLTTGRHAEAGYILRTFAQHVRDGLIPNLFPEGQNEGLYHTADASLWYFHALDRYLRTTGDVETLKQVWPKLIEIYEHHLRGTRFGIGVDPADGLLRQGAAGYQLTWMDAKVGDWVVTPRRGKAVEINALWYNALRLLAGWSRQQGSAAEADAVDHQADKVYRSFNERFWYAEGDYLYDVIDGEGGNDPACRPNQVFAISLPHPVLDPVRWRRVMDVTRERLLTPMGLRTLAPGHPDYKPTYDGDLRARDAAYHQGTVWPWLIGPFVDAWLKVDPDDRATPSAFLDGFRDHLNEACVGTISEIFDAEAPYWPRGCAAQAWSVAEVLRCLVAIPARNG
jgi:predicted glycogen debranching enzyme